MVTQALQESLSALSVAVSLFPFLGAPAWRRLQPVMASLARHTGNELTHGGH